jgi:predicted O-linked N-acetylglucosamine transferase (SPINDLY family)
VGLVSGDFNNHPVGFFLENVLAHLDTARIELVAYATQRTCDDLTARIMPFFSAWRHLEGVGDEAAAHLIHDDGVHILIDLAGHTAHNRLPVFAWKPAPVQVSWLGYSSTTGVAEIDYILGNPHSTPAGEAHHFTETIWQLPETSLCFSVPDANLEVAPLPAQANGFITFGCFNNLAKLNDEVVLLWARILQALPTSRLFLKNKQLGESSVRMTLLDRFAAHGISEERLLLEGRSPRSEYLRAYNGVDIVLDPFPFPGGTTTVEGLWMGAPFITRQGDRFIAHQGEMIAHNTGLLSDWIARDYDDYVAKATYFSSNLEYLAGLRAILRRHLQLSPLFNAARFARHLEWALWEMWNRFELRVG